MLRRTVLNPGRVKNSIWNTSKILFQNTSLKTKDKTLVALLFCNNGRNMASCQKRWSSCGQTLGLNLELNSRKNTHRGISWFSFENRNWDVFFRKTQKFDPTKLIQRLRNDFVSIILEWFSILKLNQSFKWWDQNLRFLIKIYIG